MKLILILLLTQTACAAQPPQRFRPLIKYIRIPAPTPAPQKPKIVYNEVTNIYNYTCKDKNKGETK